MKRGIVVGLIFAACVELKAQVHIKEIDAYCARAVKEWNCPGMAIGMIYNDSVILAKGYGTLSVKDSTPVDANTIFGIASNTKSFTAAALAKMVDEHRIEWDHKVIDYVPYFRMYDDYVTQEMTIRDLLCHRSGLKTFAGDLIWYNSEYSRKEIIEHAQFLKPSYGFREHYGYSNIMYLVASEVLKTVYGKSWDDYMRKEIFAKLGMTRTSVSITDLKKEKNVAQPHAKVDGKWIPIPYVNWDNMAPAGGINSTVNDMLKWLRLQLNHGRINDSLVLFSAKQSREMWLPQTIDNVSTFSERLYPTKHFSAYGLGWDLFDIYGYKIVNHAGGLDGMISQTVMIPELNIGFVILVNQASSLPYVLMHQIIEYLIGNPAENDYSMVYLNLIKDYEDYIAEKEKEKERLRDKSLQTTFSLDKYAGIYSGNVYGTCKVELKGSDLYLKLKHTPTLHGKLVHWSGNTFTIEFKEHPSLPKGDVTFILDKEETKVLRLIIDVPNPDFDFTELDFNKVK